MSRWANFRKVTVVWYWEILKSTLYVNVCSNSLLLLVLIETSMSAVFDSQARWQDMFSSVWVLWSRAEMEMCQCSSGCAQIPRKMINESHAISRGLVFPLITASAIKLTGFSVVPDEDHATCQHAVNMTDRTTKTFDVLMQMCIQVMKNQRVSLTYP